MKLKELGSIRHTVIGFALIILCFVAASIADAAPIDAVQDTRQPDTLCKDGLMAVGECPEGYEYVEPSQFEYSLLFDSFEYETIPVFRTDIGAPDGNKWRNNQTDTSATDTRPNNTFTTDVVSLYGNRSMQIERLDGGTSDREFQLFFFNNKGTSNNWQFLHEEIGGWEFNKVNQARFWMKAPPEMDNDNVNGSAKDTGQGESVHFATFLRDSNTPRSSNETAPHHYYHVYDPKYEGNLWWQFIVDPHPHHMRDGQGGNVERGIITEPFPTVDPLKNYWDTMVYFYIDHKNTNSLTPANYYIDGIEFYENPNDEDIFNISQPYMIYNDITDEIVFGWRRPKTDPDVTFDLKYADTSFYENGGFSNHGSPMPNGTGINNGRSLNPDGYNGVKYRGQIDVSGKDFIYLAIKASTEAARFREFKIPVTANGYPAIGGAE